MQNILWSPNRLEYAITGDRAGSGGTLVVNQNYFPGWMVQSETDRCQRASDYNGLLAAKTSGPGDRITLEYRPFASLLCQAAGTLARALW